MNRKAEEFRDAAIEHNITWIPKERCPVCETLLGYIIENGQLFYDKRCQCTIGYDPPEPKRWQDVADWYNSLTDTNEIIDQYLFWHFNDPIPLNGAELIAAERATHPDRGFTPEHDAQYTNELGKAATYLLTGDEIHWPKEWDVAWKKKFDSKSILERLVIAGSLIAAEIDRILAEGDQKRSEE